MSLSDRYDKIFVGFLAGLVLPFVIGFFIYLFGPGDVSLASFLAKLVQSNIVTHSITLCVFPNIFIFLIFNRFDMLRASQGVLAVTIIWAVVVFGVKFLT